MTSKLIEKPWVPDDMSTRLEISMNGESHVNFKLDTITHVLSYNEMLALCKRMENLKRVWGSASIGISEFPIKEKL